MVTWKSPRCVYLVNKLDRLGWKLIEEESNNDNYIFEYHDKHDEDFGYGIAGIEFNEVIGDYTFITMLRVTKPVYRNIRRIVDIPHTMDLKELSTFTMLMAELRALKELEEKGSNDLQSV